MHSASDTKSLPAAFGAVIEESFFACADPCPQSALDDRWPADGAWIYAMVSFLHEGHSGQVEIALPAGLAASLSAAFAGCDTPELTDALVADGTGELCNMVCGLWLTRVRPYERFTLSAPLVERGLPPLPQGWGFLAINDVPAGFRFSEVA